jgi:hypothetical protein
MSHGSPEPDWAALADRHQSENRRRRRLTIVAAVAGVAVVGGLVATAVVVSGHGSRDDARAVAATTGTGASPDGSAGPAGAVATAIASAAGSRPASSSPSRPASASASASRSASKRPTATASASSRATDPLTAISQAGTDTAPLTAAGLFSARTLTIDGYTWTRTLTGSTSPCWKATTGGLGDVLAVSECQVLLRATYVSGSSAVTVGVAVFDHKAQADIAERDSHGQIQGLTAAGSISFCTSAGCVNTHAAVGRYGYFTVSGSVKTGGTTADAVATAAGPDLATYAHGRLLQRGKDAVS